MYNHINSFKSNDPWIATLTQKARRKGWQVSCLIDRMMFCKNGKYIMIRLSDFPTEKQFTNACLNVINNEIL